MGQHKRGIARTQTALLPPAVEDYVSAHALVRVIDRYVRALDLAVLGFAKSMPAATGRPGYAPDDLLALYLYGYWNQVRSSRRLEIECKRNLEVMWLMGQLAPDHKTIADFRRMNAAPFEAACAQFVQFLQEAQLVGGELPVVAVDGSKFKACASKKSVVDAEQVAKQRKKVERRIAEYLKEMDEADRIEDGQAQPTPKQIEAALERLRKRDKKLEQAQAELAQREQGSEGQDKTVRVGLTDPDCVLLKQSGGGALAGYNVQQAVDTQHHLIVAHEVTTRANDHTSLEPTASQAQAALKAGSMIALADRGFMNGEQAETCEARGITPVVPMPEVSNTQGEELYAKTKFVYDEQSDTYRCPAGELLTRYKRAHATRTDYYGTSACAGCALKAQCTRGKRRSIARSWFAAAAERAHQRAARNPRLMRLRSASVEHPFGNLKAMLRGGFSMRTLAKVKGEMALAVLTYNLKRTLSILGIDKLLEKLGTSTVLSGA
jgi:transposase